MEDDLHSTSTLDDRIAVEFSRFVTRRRFLQKTMRWALGSGVAIAGALALPGVSRAASCSPGGAVSTWGCYCATDHPACSGCSGDGYCGSHRVRCTYWHSSPYCWCSESCCIGGTLGFYSCCDCWSDTSSTNCGTGTSPCICKQRQGGMSCAPTG